MSTLVAAAPAVADAAEALQQVACNLCGGTDEEELYPPLPASRHISPAFGASLGVRGTSRIVRCRSCELCYVSPRLGREQVLAAYRDAIDDLYVSQASARRRSFRGNVRLVRRYAGGGRLLDVGCAAGYFLDVAAEAGFVVAGVEPNRRFVRMAQERHGPSVLEGTLHDVPPATGPFDVVTMWDVLEHSTDPRAEIAAAWRLLRPGGLLFVNFPHIGSLLARFSGSSWWFLLSHHLTYFTPATLSRMLESEGLGTLARRPCLQTLELGYLCRMARMYAPAAAATAERALARLRLSRVPIPYYAGQVTLVAAR